MRRRGRVGLLLAGLLLAPPALAQDEGGEAATDAPRTKFYNFDELRLTGDRVRPRLLFTDAKLRATFEKLFSLRRSFMPELRSSGDGRSLTRPGGGR